MEPVSELPELQRPLVIAAFEGWSDAGGAASLAVEHLADAWNATLVSTTDPEGYYDYQVNRPRLVGSRGERSLQWPGVRILHAIEAPTERDVLLIVGVEPSFGWRRLCEELLDELSDAGAEEVITLGALLADAAHTRPLPVSVSSDDPVLRRRHDLEPSLYQGPVGVLSVFGHLAWEAGLGVMSAWVSVPHYAGAPPSPKATVALLHRLERLLGFPVPMGELLEDAEAWERGVNELSLGDDEVAEYVASLEEAQDTSELPEASGDAIAREFEQYLRRRGDDSGGKEAPEPPLPPGLG